MLLMSNPETLIENEAVKEVYEQLGIQGSKLSIKGEDGYPDRIFWLPGGKPLLVEYKQPGESPRPSQQKIIDQLRLINYNVEVHYSAADTIEACIKILDSPQIPKESRKILARALMRCAILRSRSG